MTTPDDPRNFNREVRQTSYQDNDGRIHEVKRTTETLNTNPDGSYNNGYYQGRRHQRNLAERDSENTARGLLIGALLAGLAALGGGLVWYASQRDETYEPVVVPVPEQTQNNPAPEANNPDTKNQTTIIERVKEVPVEVEKVKEVPVEIRKETVREVPVPVPQQQTQQTQPTAPDNSRTSVTNDPVLNDPQANPRDTEANSETNSDRLYNTDTTDPTDPTNNTDPSDPNTNQ